MNRFDFEVKSLDERGLIEGIASPYHNVDRQGDVVLPGAFTKTLAESGGRVPLLWQHQQDEPIGVAHLVDGSNGLGVRAQLDLDVPMGQRAYSALKKKILRGLSIGYSTVKSTTKGGARQLLELKLYEVSLVTIPANELAEVTSVKRNEPQGLLRLRTMVDDLSTLGARVSLGATVRQMRQLAQTIKSR